MTLNVLDLFSGIGGFSLGLERAGMRTVAFCEIDPYCRRVLAKHWPTVPVFGDIRELTAEHIVANAAWDVCSQQAVGGAERQRTGTGRQSIDVICGGFPCQDISTAGKGAGIGGARSGLWSEYARIIGEVRPRYVIVENVAALLGRGLERVLGDLAALGYDAEWHCVPASAVGAPHRRDRVWIVGYSDGDGQSALAVDDEMAGLCGMVADAARIRVEGNGSARQQEPRLSVGAELSRCNGARGCADQWRIEPDVVRVVHGVPGRVDRIRSLGNAVVPQIPEIIGRAIMTAISSQQRVNQGDGQ